MYTLGTMGSELCLQFEDIPIKVEFISFSSRLEIKIKMEHSQIIGEELLKGVNISRKYLKRKVVLVLKIGLGLNDQDGTGSQLIHDGQPMSSEVRPLNQNMPQIRPRTKIINKVLGGIFGDYYSYESYQEKQPI